VTELLARIQATTLATWTRESTSIWAYPTILTLHTIGLGIVVGANAVVDLRLLGFGPRIPLPSLRPLFRIVWWAFGLNTITGILLFMADATTKATQIVFYVKLTLIGLALWNTVLARRIIFRASPTQEPLDARFRNRRLAVVSLLLWAGAITAGRLMAYL
jgi:hypothetical protein